MCGPNYEAKVTCLSCVLVLLSFPVCGMRKQFVYCCTPSFLYSNSRFSYLYRNFGAYIYAFI
ncbi:hypothetical protein CDL12_12423 [Handroanthus impetiginosus]|uniref:Uncharacterized protein n=1 Tax=Handroanthus impetiginosus TaxID=429701 RepID=A0A2G9HBR9_9LAMI|nr:hypothetical protein CDL12_12423 [Handroanthus impetiginosus]